VIRRAVVTMSFVSLALLPIAAEAQLEPAADPPLGKELFIQSCASCHGSDASGTDRGPSLLGSGIAAVDFQLRTGRMPLADPDAQTVRKPPAFTDEEIDALLVYLGTIVDGPEVPVMGLSDADVSAGQSLFTANCAPCHGATANGGAVGPGAIAPNLFVAEPVEIAEAMLTGPGEMPVFTAFSETEIRDVVAFVTYLQEQRPPGGADIGGVGPVPEGFVGWAGVLVLVAICFFLGSKGAAE
jgi:ubiquinol-cytochrome c reductase cytochrome c subunit